MCVYLAQLVSTYGDSHPLAEMTPHVLSDVRGGGDGGGRFDVHTMPIMYQRLGSEDVGGLLLVVGVVDTPLTHAATRTLHLPLGSSEVALAGGHLNTSPHIVLHESRIKLALELTVLTITATVRTGESDRR